jgi:hypothetical protein
LTEEEDAAYDTEFIKLFAPTLLDPDIEEEEENESLVEEAIELNGS